MKIVSLKDHICTWKVEKDMEFLKELWRNTEENKGDWHYTWPEILG